MGNGGDVPSHRNARRRPASGQALALGGAQARAWRSKGNAAGRRRPGAGGTPRSHGEGKASRDAGPWRAGGRLGRRQRGLRPVHRQRLDPDGDALSGLAQLLDRPVRVALGDVARPGMIDQPLGQRQRQENLKLSTRSSRYSGGHHDLRASMRPGQRGPGIDDGRALPRGHPGLASMRPGRRGPGIAHGGQRHPAAQLQASMRPGRRGPGIKERKASFHLTAEASIRLGRRGPGIHVECEPVRDGQGRFNEAGAKRPRNSAAHPALHRLLIRFNEAGAKRPRNSTSPSSPRPWRRSFNEAGAKRPRNSTASRAS